jgi:hypothetical protein
MMPKVFKFNKLKTIFPEIRRDKDYIEVMKIKDIDVRNSNIRTIISKYLKKLLNELRFEEILDITYGKNFIKSCKVFTSKQAFNCSESKYGFFKYNYELHSLTFTIIFENKTNSLYQNNAFFVGSLEKIELELKGQGYMNVDLGSFTSRYYSKSIYFEENTKTEIGFTSYTYKRLNIHKEICLEGNNQNRKNYFSKRDCSVECFHRKFIQTYGCLPAFRDYFHLDFETLIVYRGYRTCDKTINLITESMQRECLDICLPNCESVHYNTMVLTKEFQERKVRTFVEIFPVKFPHFVYTETLNMDFNQLIYNCGGILGLWFGLSPLSLDDLVRSLRSVRMKSIIFASIHFVLLIAFKSKKMIILFYVFLGRLLRSGYVHLKSIINKLIDFILLIAFKSKQSIIIFCKFLVRSLRSIYVHLKSIIYKLFVFIFYMFIELKRMITNLFLFLLMRRNNRIGIE